MTSARSGRPRYAGASDSVTLYFTASEVISSTVLINGQSVTASSNGLLYSATYTFNVVAQYPSDGSTVTFSIAYSDEAGNAGSSVSEASLTSSSLVTFGRRCCHVPACTSPC